MEANGKQKFIVQTVLNANGKRTAVYLPQSHIENTRPCEPSPFEPVSRTTADVIPIPVNPPPSKRICKGPLAIVESGEAVQHFPLNESPVQSYQLSDRLEPHLMEYLNEMKHTLAKILKGQNEIRESQTKIQKQMESITKRQTALETTIKCMSGAEQTKLRVDGHNLEFKRISTVEELEEIDTKLKDSEYFEKLSSWISSSITKIDTFNRLHQALDMVFDRNFLPLCSWTGGGRPEKKIPMKMYKNIIQLFVSVGTTNHTSCNEEIVADFFLKKLKYAKNRLNLQGYRQTSCHQRFKQ